jgi:DNA adenine methylase
MAHENLVFVSEYAAPEDFGCVWSGEVLSNFASTRATAKVATEKLFKVSACNPVALP